MPCMIENSIWAKDSISWEFLGFGGDVIGVTQNGKHYPNSILSSITFDRSTIKIGLSFVNIIVKMID